MIPKEIFAQRMALLAGRIGRELEPPVLREYYVQLSEALTTEQFIAAMELAFRTWDAAYRNWPSPEQLVALITPTARPALAALEAFEQIAALHRWPVCSPQPRPHDVLEQIQAMGATALRAYRAAGGWREFYQVMDDDRPWLRKRFVEAYDAATENADAERAATLALASASAEVRELTDGLAAKLATPLAKRLPLPLQERAS